jgi:hypothetical protein
MEFFTGGDDGVCVSRPGGYGFQPALHAQTQVAVLHDWTKRPVLREYAGHTRSINAVRRGGEFF